MSGLIQERPCPNQATAYGSVSAEKKIIRGCDKALLRKIRKQYNRPRAQANFEEIRGGTLIEFPEIVVTSSLIKAIYLTRYEDGEPLAYKITPKGEVAMLAQIVCPCLLPILNPKRKTLPASRLGAGINATLSWENDQNGKLQPVLTYLDIDLQARMT